jgi:hypothetical protein
VELKQRKEASNSDWMNPNHCIHQMCSEALRSLCISSGLEAVDLIRKALESGE